MVKAKKTNAQLDLDALNPSIGDVKLGGKKYKVYQPGYGDFVLMPELFEQLGNSGELPREEKERIIGEMKELIQRLLPDMPGDMIRAFTFRQLMGLIEFVSEKFTEQMGINPDEEEGAEAGKGKQD